MADIRIPVSAIHGFIDTPGAAASPPFTRLRNPNASGKNLRIYEVYVGQEGITNRMRMRRIAASPITLGGIIITGLVARRDETDATAFQGVLEACDTPSAVFAETTAFWFDKPAPAGSSGYFEQPIIRPLAFPL